VILPSSRSPRLARIFVTGSELAAEIRTNEAPQRTLDTSDACIRSRTGIGARRIAAEGVETSEVFEAALTYLAIPLARLDLNLAHSTSRT
jgi:3-oxoacyl-[acyl-carrier-protein] synthase-3